MIKYFCILIFWISKIIYIGAQEVPRTLNFTKNDDHAQNQIWAIAQTPQYEMFFGNNDGLLSFNGSFWKTLQMPQKPIVRAVASDAKGRVFVGGFAEFGFFERDEMGNFQYHSLSKDVRFEKVKREEIWHILVYGQTIYFQSFSTIYKYDYKDVTVLSPPSNIMFLKAVNNRLWIQGLSKGLYELKDDNSFRFIEGSTFLANKTVSMILPHGKGLLIGTAKDGIFKYENERFLEWQSSAQIISKEFELNKGFQLSNGNYAFGTILNGVYIVKPDGSILYHINKENGLQNNTVIALHEDLAHNLWLGLDKGVDLIDLNSPLTFFQDKTGKLGAVYAAVLHSKQLYVGTNQGLFYRNMEGGDFKLLKGTQGQVWDLKVMDGQLLCGHNAGTFLIDNNNVIQKMSDVTGGWHLIRHPTRQDLLYQATYTGIILFKKNQKNQWIYHQKLSGLGAPIRKIVFDEKNNLWAVTAQNQLYQFKLDATGEQTYMSDGSEGIALMKLPKGSIISFSQIENQLLFSTDSASFIFKDNVFMETHEMNGIGLGRFMLKKGLNQDVFKIHKNYVEILNGSEIPNQSGLRGSLSTRLGLKLIPQYEDVIVLDSTHYLFGLDDGYAILNRNNLQIAPIVNPKILVSLHTKDGKVFPFYADDNSKTKLTLPPQYRAFRMDFALPYFLEDVQFQYKNNNQEWSNFSESPSSEFVNLSSGEQVFKVRNNITDEATTLVFDIKPYWYETIWAKILYFLAFIGLFFLLQKYHHHQLERQRLKLELEKQREIEQHRITADNEKLHADIINKSKDLANSTMSIIQKNEILMEIKEELGNLKIASRDSLSDKHYRHLQHLIDINLTHKESQKVFEDNFNTVHEDFLKRLKHQHTDLTAGDLKLAAYLRMNLSSKEISPLLFISVRSIENKRSRLRKKMGLNDSDNLTEYLIQF